MNSQTSCQTETMSNCSAVIFHALSRSLTAVSKARASLARPCIGVMDRWACPACEVKRQIPASSKGKRSVLSRASKIFSTEFSEPSVTNLVGR